MAQPPIINVNDVELVPWGDGNGFQAQLGMLGARVGAKKLGYRVVVLMPNMKAWPYHAHYVNEEMFLVLEGVGTLRFAGSEHPIKAGDVIACPADADKPHQIVNTSNEPLRYLAVSTMEHPEVAHYPDSEKIGVMVGAPPGSDPSKRKFFLFKEASTGVDYWEGEA